MTSTAAPARPIAAVEGRQRGPRSPIAWLLAAAAPVLGLLFVAGWRYGAVGPLFAVAMLVLATLDSAWGQVFHTENLVVLHLLILAAGPAADVLAVGRPRPRPARATGADDPAHHEDLDDPGRPTGPDDRYGWPVRLAAVAVVLAYVLAGIAKLRIGGAPLVPRAPPPPPRPHQ